MHQKFSHYRCEKHTVMFFENRRLLRPWMWSRCAGSCSPATASRRARSPTPSAASAVETRATSPITPSCVCSGCVPFTSRASSTADETCHCFRAISLSPCLQRNSKEIVEAANEVGVLHYQVLARLHDVDKSFDKKGTTCHSCCKNVIQTSLVNLKAAGERTKTDTIVTQNTELNGHCLVPGFADKAQEKAFDFYKKECMAVEILKDGHLQRVHFRVRNKVRGTDRQNDMLVNTNIATRTRMVRIIRSDDTRSSSERK